MFNATFTVHNSSGDVVDTASSHVEALGIVTFLDKRKTEQGPHTCRPVS